MNIWAVANLKNMSALWNIYSSPINIFSAYVTRYLETNKAICGKFVLLEQKNRFRFQHEGFLSFEYGRYYNDWKTLQFFSIKMFVRYNFGCCSGRTDTECSQKWICYSVIGLPSHDPLWRSGLRILCNWRRLFHRIIQRCQMRNNTG